MSKKIIFSILGIIVIVALAVLLNGMRLDKTAGSLLLENNYKNKDENIFIYEPGEIIVKYKKEQDYELANVVGEGKVKKWFDFDGVKSEKVFSRIDLRENEKMGFANIIIYKIPCLKNKAEEFIEKAREKIKYSSIKKINIFTNEFGFVEIDLQEPFIDPYTKELLDALNRNVNIEYAEENFSYHTDAVNYTDLFYPLMWPLENNEQEYPIVKDEFASGLEDADIDAETGWKNDNSDGGNGVIVAIIDTGIDYTHEDLGACDFESIMDDDEKTCPKFVSGYDFVNNDNNPIDDTGHGTHCAGIISALNNEKGIIGIAYKSKLMAVKGLDSWGGGTADDLANAVLWAVDNGADVLSNSWGGRGYSQLLEDVFECAYENGVVSVASAGNSHGKDAMLFIPAGFNSVITVGASDSSDRLASFSNAGPKIDVVAPGVDILSLKGSRIDERDTRIFEKNYYIASGTSMSAPHVAGAASLIKANYPKYKPEQIRQMIRMGADDLGDEGFDEKFGYGRLNIGGSLEIIEDVPDMLLKNPARQTIAMKNFVADGRVMGEGVEFWGLFYKEIDEDELQPFEGNSCSGTASIENFLCELDISGLYDDKDYYIVLKVVSNGRIFYDYKKIVVDNLAISNIMADDIYRLGDKMKVNGRVLNNNFLLEWSKSGEEKWSTEGILKKDKVIIGDDTDLAEWNTAGLFLDEGYYDLKLSVGENNERVDRIYFNPYLKKGWPVRIDYDYDKRNDNYYGIGDSMPVASDVFGDSDKEIIVLITGLESKIIIYNKKGEQIRKIKIETESGYLPNTVPYISDMDADGKGDIIFADTAKLHVINGEGSYVKGYPIYLPYDGEPRLVVGDLDNDGNNEIIIKGNRSDKERILIVREGRVIKEWKLEHSEEWFSIAGGPVLGNFDDDADLEIAIAGPSVNNGYDEEKDFVNEDGVVAIYNMDGTFVDGWPKYTGGYAISSPAVADIDKDGKDDLIVSLAFSPYSKNDKLGGIYVFNRSGDVLPEWPSLIGKIFYSSSAIADINNDGYLEIVVSDTLNDNFNIYAIDRYGKILNGWSKNIVSSNDYYSAVIGDINNDGFADVIKFVNGSIYGWNYEGNEIEGFPKITEKSSGGLIGVFDIDNDKKLEIIASSNQDYDSQNKKSKHRGSIYIWDLKEEYENFNLPWPVFQHDLRRTGNSGF